SGTGSPTIEQLMRLGAALIVGVDDDHMEERNVNRILNSTMEDAKKGRAKVDILPTPSSAPDSGPKSSR
ncbi:MAG: hypothetical protein ACLPX7_07820, partial [Xanthobacteraceae bacterium]